MDMTRRWFKPKVVAIVAGFALVAILGFVDFVSGNEVSFALFYFLPLFITSWLAGRGPGIVMALVTGAICLVTDHREGEMFSNPWIPYFNLATRTGVFLVVALLVSTMKELAETLEERVEQRTNELRAEIAERKRAQAAQSESDERFRMFMDNNPAVTFLKDAAGRYVYVNPAFQNRFKVPLLGKTSSDLFPPDVAARMQEGDRAVLAAGKIFEFAETFTFPDGSSSHWLNFRFLLKDVFGKTFIGGISVDISEIRQLERQLLEISDREQARIGQDLHDGLCQVLVSAAFDCNMLEQRLASNALPECGDVQRISRLLDDAITQARHVSRGLYPVKLEAEGLMSGLEELASNVGVRFKVPCVLQCDHQVRLTDNVVSTHLYRIAQEAVTNAIRHASASQICIRLQLDGGMLVLSVMDDGIGMIPRQQRNGMGLHIMEYRSRTIGAKFHLDSRKGAGTTITVSVPLVEARPT
jgi:PAS domain S-box-containing protein